MRDIKTHVSHADAHQKVTPAKEFSNQVDGMLHSVDSQILIIAQLAHEQVITVAKTEVMRILYKTGFHVPILVLLRTNCTKSNGYHYTPNIALFTR